MLEARLLHNQAASAAWNAENSRFEIAIPCRKPRYLVPPISWIVRPPEKRTMVLDSIGIEVWEACAGERTVEEIIDQFASRHGLTFHEGRVAVVAFLKSLLERGAVVLLVPDQGMRNEETFTMARQSEPGTGSDPGESSS
jgi:hypothetical protein